MAISTAAAYGIYPQNVVLADIVRNLNQAGFANEDICMMLSPSHPIASIVRDASLFSTDRQDSAASAGMIGWLSAFGAVLIPTVGFFIRSRVFLHALMVAREVPALCGNGVLVYVSCAENAKTLWAREVLRHTGARETNTLEETVMSATAAA
jgi:hypothetical protein